MLGEYWNLRVDRHDRVFVITLQKAPENRLNTKFAQEIIRALRDIEQELGPDSEGCVITKGNDEKFWCTGLDLDESDSNPFANSDGFFPVRTLPCMILWGSWSKSRLHTTLAVVVFESKMNCQLTRSSS